MRVRHPHQGFIHPKGFTLIELMIVIAMIAVMVTLALPVYQDYTIRAKVAEGLSLSSRLKTMVTESCRSDPNISLDTIIDAGYSESISSEYMEILDASTDLGVLSLPNCTLPWVAFRTRNTGAEIEPVVVLIGTVLDGRTAWHCALFNGNPSHVPADCRQSLFEAFAAATGST